MANEWKVGDTVELKSGGPVMTIHGKVPGGKDSVVCVWFAGNERKADSFHPETLRTASPPAARA